MQGTVVMLLALSGLGCHHKKCEPAYSTACYTSCYSATSCYSTTSCYSSSQCYSSSSCYSSCYSSSYDSCYSSSCYSSKKHKHGLFGCKKKSCAACCVAEPVAPVCDACGTYSGPGVYGTYTPAYSSSQTMGTMQSMPVPVPAATAPVTPPAPTPAADTPPPAPVAPVTPPPAVPAPDAPK